jgi:hypothetical protein
MIRRDTPLWRNVAEHSFLLLIVAAHSLVSSAFLHSDEFSYIKVAVEPGFFNELLVALPETWRLVLRFYSFPNVSLYSLHSA